MRSLWSRREAIAEPIVGGMSLIVGVVGYFIVVMTTMAFTGVINAMGPLFWVGSVIALVGYGAAFAVVLTPPPGALSRRSAIVATVLVVLAQATTWTTSVIAPTSNVVVYEPLVVTAYAIYVMIIFRNYFVEAWCGVLAGVLCTGVLGPHTGSDAWWTAMQSTSLVVVVVVSAASLALTPLLGEIDALAMRHRRFAAESGKQRVTSARREERIERIDRRVRPVLEHIVATGTVTADDVAFARLTEARLRDGIRAPAFDTAAIRESVWRARERGVSVTLLDDGGLRELTEADTASFLAELLPLVCAELDALSEGEIIARVTPPGRSPIAMVTVVLRGTRRRVEFGRDGRVARVVQV